MHGIYTNGHHLSLISGRRSENAALNPITSPWQSPTVVRRREEDTERKRKRKREGDKEGDRESVQYRARDGGGSVGV